MQRVEMFGLTEMEYELILKKLGREPNETELSMISVMWSEHCGYKHSKSSLRRLPTRGPRVIQGPGENAGVVDIGDGLAVVFKMESHNHPSAVEPFHGAATGVGGIVRDVLAMGARPIALLDSLRFGDPTSARVKYLFHGVVSGISFYGNCIGVPTVGGEVYFHSCYSQNPLVNVMCVGLVEKKHLKFARASKSNASLLLVGSLTGRDGIGGASFASENLSDDSEKKRPCVQIADPFMEKLLIEACVESATLDCVLAIQDLGAAGLTSACSEVAAKGGKGVLVDLSLVPVREEAMTPREILLSESQERMLLVVEKGFEETVAKIFKKWGLRASKIGEIVDDGFFTAIYDGKIVVRLPVKLLTEAPIIELKPSAMLRRRTTELNVPIPKDLNTVFLKILGSPNVCSRKYIFEQYDHMVGIDTVLRPGHDAAIIRIKGTNRAIATVTDCNPLYCSVDPYIGAQMAVCEAARNLVVVGAEPLGITDCLNFGDPEDPTVAYAFERTIDGIKDAAETLNIPVVSGNVSFYNESDDSRVHPTPVIGMVGIIEDLSKICSAAFKRSNDLIVLLGPLESGESLCEYVRLIHGIEDAPVPTIDLMFEKRLHRALLRAIKKDLLSSAHDVSEGGLAVALAECCILGNVGASCEIESRSRTDFLLFGERPSRIVASLSEENLSEFARLMNDESVPFTIVGRVGGTSLVIKVNGKTLIEEEVSKMKSVYERSLEKLVNE
ncbi:phosphoribosylformylglycinamidine synthase subunit PurL [Pseudothermotoga sp.]|nr:phosphoribosylformylglycinamidine synthase subunit PurL [Pseudothermotoga sp.]MDW8139564.1 phosphoribosylformylglycinamidine synthase subunit PurL [Pseudothermotoga sp.]